MDGGLRIYGLLCPSSGSGWDGRVCGVVVRYVCLPDCGWDGHVWCFFLVVERLDLICFVRELDNAICEFPICVPCFG